LNKWIPRLLICGSLLAVGSFLLYRWLAAEPAYEGRPLSAWLDDLQRGSTQASRERAAEVLKGIDPEGLRYLSGHLTNPPTPLQRAARAMSGHVPNRLKEPLRRFYDPSQNFSRKLATLEALKAIGTNGATVVPAVEKALRQENVLLSSVAAMTLGQLGTNSVPVLIAALDDPDYNVRSPAGHALATFTTNAAPAAPRLARIARDEIGPMNSVAFYALSRVGKAAVPSLTELVASTNAAIRSQALYALTGIGPAAEEARPVILAALDDPVPEVRWRAIEALSVLEGNSAEAQEAFVAALSDPDANVRAAGISALSFRPRITHANFGKVFEMLHDSSPGVRAQAAFALGQTGRWGAEAIPYLEAAANDTNSAVSTGARRAIETIRNSQKIAAAEKLSRHPLGDQGDQAE
jgi:HEAT repeat protein